MIPRMECPDENELLRFSLGETAGPRQDALELHFDTCSTCRSALAAVALGSARGSASTTRQLEWEAGARLGRYRVERRVGAGAMGTVYAARDVELDRPVALKVLHSAHFELEGPDDRARILREARAMARLSHPNVVSVFEVGEDPQGVPFLAMELVEGRTLDVWLKAGARTTAEILAVFREAGAALAAAHQAGLVHGDFKPQNLLVGSDGRAQVTDFGLARHGAPDLDPPEAPLLAGTPAYMAPEQLKGRASPASDQFSFCVSLYEALAGQRPFEGPTLQALQRSISEDLGARGPGSIPKPVYAVLRRGLSPHPQARFPDMASLLAALERPHRRRFGLVAASLVALVLLAAVGWRMSRPSARPAVHAGLLTLHLGARMRLPLTGLTRLSIRDPTIANIHMTPTGEAELTAERAGDTTLLTWSSEGERTYDVRVTPPPAP